VAAKRPSLALTIAAVSLLALALSGCSTGGSGPQSTSSGPTTSATGSPSATGTPASGTSPSAATTSGDGSSAGSASAPATAGTSPTAEPTAANWKTFTDSGHKVSFDLPQEWIAQQAAPGAGGQAGALSIDVKDAGSTRMASLNTQIAGRGGACGPGGLRPYTVLASIPMEIPSAANGPQSVPPRFVYRLVQGSNKFYASYGITDHAAGTDGKVCMMDNSVSGPGGDYMFGDVLEVSGTDNQPGLKAFDTIADAQKYILTSEFQNLQRMITSLKIAF
jgi:hypothetical protein